MRAAPALTLAAWLIAGTPVMTVAAAADRDAPPALTLHSDSTRATAGYFRLHWSAGPSIVELEEATDPSFHDGRRIYRGSDRARLVSGKPDGWYYYRIRATRGDAQGAWSAPVGVEVEHHPRGRALLFFALGAAVFCATVGLILAGQRIAGR